MYTVGIITVIKVSCIDILKYNDIVRAVASASEAVNNIWLACRHIARSTDVPY